MPWGVKASRNKCEEYAIIKGNERSLPANMCNIIDIAMTKVNEWNRLRWPKKKLMSFERKPKFFPTLEFAWSMSANGAKSRISVKKMNLLPTGKSSETNIPQRTAKAIWV